MNSAWPSKWRVASDIAVSLAFHEENDTISAYSTMYRLAETTDGLFTLQGLPDYAIGVVGRGANSIDYGQDKFLVRRAEKALLNRITGIAESNILLLDQIHSDRIVPIDEMPATDLTGYAEADGMVTALGGLCLVIRTADCVPVFIIDRARQVLGAVHSGWRGTRLAIAAGLVRLMRDRYGSVPAELEAFILPAIGPQSYTVNEDVAVHFPGSIVSRDGQIFLDLWGAIEKSLVAEGMHPEKIFHASRCTMTDHRSFFSHRKGDIGRNLNYIYLR